MQSIGLVSSGFWIVLDLVWSFYCGLTSRFPRLSSNWTGLVFTDWFGLIFMDWFGNLQIGLFWYKRFGLVFLVWFGINGLV